METIFVSIFLAAAVFNLVMRLRLDLQMLQQNSYRNERYGKWLRTSGDVQSLSRLVDLLVVLLLFTPFPKVFTLSAGAVIMIVKGVSVMTRKQKKPLVMTKRVWRLFVELLVFVAIVASFGALQGIGFDHTLRMACYVVAAVPVVSWLIVLLCNASMQPVERAINKMYVDDARQRLAGMTDMKIIGITGSYGKTSTKHYLNRILSEQFDVLMTPGSFNTPMGVVRTVRELMKPYNEVFIVEMGAKNIGDIKEICDIVHPQIGIVTAVGEQHLESFKSIENVQRTKFELIDALPSDGFGVVNDDFEYVANRPVDNVKTYRYAVRNTDNADYRATDIEYDEFGTHFTIEGADRSLRLDTRLVGECNISNLMAAVIVAMRLGVADEKIKYAVSHIEQVEHRLNMKRTPAGVTIIDDAFNSNPDGSRMALDVLSRMTKGKRIVVTPGMIELGDKQHFHNANFGEHIAETVDVAIIVGRYNRDAIVEGIRRSGKLNDDAIVIVDSFAEAQQRLAGIISKGDTVLYENDLPDTFK